VCTSIVAPTVRVDLNTRRSLPLFHYTRGGSENSAVLCSHRRPLFTPPPPPPFVHMCLSSGEVKVIMATNKIETLDPALIRPGRIDRKIEFPLPDVNTKRHIFGIHTGRMTLGEDVDLEKFIMSKDDLSGADIKAVCTEAGMLALRERRMKVTHDDFEKAKEKALYRKKGNIPEGLYL